MKIGVVGMGSIGQRHAENARKLGHQVVSYDPAGSSDYRFERLLYDDKSVDAVVVATPSQFHEGPLRAAVERGKHVLIEKPISVSEGGLQAILMSAAEKRLVIMMGNNLRFHPCVKRGRQWLDSHGLGEPRWANFICATEWTETANRDGVILNTGAHEVDVALHFFGPAVPVIATRQGQISADFVLHHDSGVRSTFHIDIDTPDRVRHFIVSCANGTFAGSLDKRLFTVSSPASHDLDQGSYADDYLAEMGAFVDRIEGKDVPGATGEEGLEALRLLLGVRKAAGL